MKNLLLISFLLTIFYIVGCSGRHNKSTTPKMELKPFKEISAIELFEKVLTEKGYSTQRKQQIYIANYGQWQVDLWVDDDKLPLVIEYLTSDDRIKIKDNLKSSKVGEKFKLTVVSTQELKPGEEITRANSKYAVIFDDRDYLFQPNPKSENRYDITIEEIKRRLNTDIVDVVEELERTFAVNNEEETSN